MLIRIFFFEVPFCRVQAAFDRAERYFETLGYLSLRQLFPKVEVKYLLILSAEQFNGV